MLALFYGLVVRLGDELKGFVELGLHIIAI
jgi:hypothetical protein